MKKFLGFFTIIVIVGTCIFFFLHDKLQISWNNSGSNEGSSISTQDTLENPEQHLNIGQGTLQNSQASNNATLTVTDALGVLARTVNVNDAVWEYYDTRVINGENYFAFAGYDEGGAMGEMLIVVNEKSGVLYCYDPSGNLSDYSEYEKSVQEGLTEAEKINGAGFANAAEDIKLVNGQVILSGFYTNMGLDEAIYQVLANNNVTTNETIEELRRELYVVHTDTRDGEDTPSFGKQTMFGMPCDLRLNYSSGKNDDGTWYGSPYLETIKVEFNRYLSNMKNINNLDLEEQVKSKIISICGEPTEIIRASKVYSQDDTSVRYLWEFENDVLVLEYQYWIDDDDEIEGFEKGNVISQLLVKSRAYIDRWNSIVEENRKRSEEHSQVRDIVPEQP